MHPLRACPPQLIRAFQTRASLALLPQCAMVGTFDIVVLSSSPPMAPELAPSSPLYASPTAPPRRVPMSPPPLIDLSPLSSPKKRTTGASAAVSRKASIPPDAVRGFATVHSHVRSEHFAPQLDDEIAEAQSRRASRDDTADTTAAPKKPRKRPAKPPATEDGAKPKAKPRTRKPKADKAIPTHDPELRPPPPKISPYFVNEGDDAPIEHPTENAEAAPKLTKSGKPRKPRAKKEKIDGVNAEPKPKKPRATKPKTTTKTDGKTLRHDAVIQSAHFRREGQELDDEDAHGLGSLQMTNHDKVAEDMSIWDVPQSPQPKKKRAPKKPLPDPVVESLDLEGAVSRRRDWTPSRDTTVASPFTNSVGKENKQADSAANGGTFNHLVSNFTYAQAPSAQITATTKPSTTATMAATKRRRVEVSSTSIEQPAMDR
jgi:hypothetical protein